MSISHARIAVNNSTAVAVTDTSDTFTSVSIQIQNLGTGVAYLGGVGVSSTSYGVSIVAGGAVTISNIPAQDELYVIHQDASAYVAVLRVNR
jgi:hypothetical protein